MSTFHAKKYADMLQLLLFSIKNVMDTSQFDILILTDSILQSSIQEIGELLDLSLKLHIVEGITTASAASSAKLTIFEYPEIHHYERALYLDTDIIIQHDISDLFRIPIQDRLYAKEEGIIGEVYHGEWFFDFNTISRNTPAFNAGAFLFQISPTMKRIFTETYRFINECINKKVPIPVCYEQPYMNYFIIREGKQNTTLFNNYLKLDSLRWKTIKSDPDYSIIHYICNEFNGGTDKYNRMTNNLSRIVFTQPSVYEGSDTLADRTYTWNAHSITFLKGGCIQTPWGRGTYTWITNNIIELSWSIYTHRAYLNKDKTQFYSIRKNDCIIVNHKLIRVLHKYILTKHTCKYENQCSELSFNATHVTARLCAL
jgi:alpha-N-acetylglucosamine transferase